MPRKARKKRNGLYSPFPGVQLADAEKVKRAILLSLSLSYVFLSSTD